MGAAPVGQPGTYGSNGLQARGRTFTNEKPSPKNEAQSTANTFCPQTIATNMRGSGILRLCRAVKKTSVPMPLAAYLRQSQIVWDVRR